MKLLLNVYRLQGPAHTLTGTSAYVGVFRDGPPHPESGVRTRERLATEVFSGKATPDPLTVNEDGSDVVLYRRVVTVPGEPPQDPADLSIEVALVGDGQADIRLGAVLRDDEEIPAP
jgi:hypothetical protein